MLRHGSVGRPRSSRFRGVVASRSAGNFRAVDDDDFGDCRHDDAIPVVARRLRRATLGGRNPSDCCRLDSERMFV